MLYGHTKIVDEKMVLQTLDEHSKGTCQVVDECLLETKMPEKNWYRYWRPVLRALALMHDIGKGHPDFQEYMLTNNKDKQCDHKSLAPLLLEANWNPLLAYLAGGVSHAHHAGLSDKHAASSGMEILPDRPVGYYDKLAQFKIEDYQTDYPAILKRYRIHLDTYSKYMDRLYKHCRQTTVYDILREKETVTPLTISFMMRMLLSFLVDGDFRDTERFMNPERSATRKQHETIPDLTAKLQHYVYSKFQSRKAKGLDVMRDEIYRQCSEQGWTVPEKAGFFSLEAPTGSGKTFSSMIFALNHAYRHDKSRVIYVAPYLSIIDQTAQKYKRIFGHNVLEDHGNTILDEPTEHAINADNWDAPIVVTTMVQFFESLFTHLTSRTRKLHNVINSVIVLDEIQNLPWDMWYPLSNVLQILVKYYRCSVVFCSATIPDLGLPDIRPLISDPARYYHAFERRHHVVIEEEELTIEGAVQRVLNVPEVMVVVNTRAVAQELFLALKATSLKNVFHLSTLMRVEHRRAVIKKVKMLLKDHQPCYLVCTSLVEAGVDLDFAEVWRERAGIGNYIQTMGRCNRHFFLEKGIFKIFSWHDKRTPSYLSTQLHMGNAYLQEFGSDITNYDNIKLFYRDWFRRQIKAQKVLPETGGRVPAMDTRNLMPLLGNALLDFSFRTASRSSQVIITITQNVIVATPEEIDRVYEENDPRTAAVKLGILSLQLYPQDIDLLLKSGDIGIHHKEVLFLANQDLYDENMGLNLTYIRQLKHKS